MVHRRMEIFRRVDKDGMVILQVMVNQLHMYLMPDFWESAREITESSPRIVVIDLTLVSYLDSSAIGALFNIQKEIMAMDATLYLLGVNRTISMVFNLTNAGRYFKMVESLEEIPRGT